MPQSSLMTWLGKPAAVKDPPPAVKRQEIHESLRKPTKTQEVLTPPSSNEGQVSTPQPSNVPRDHVLKPSRPPLPANVQLRAPTKEDIPAFKQLNSLLLPIPYPESFYREILQEPLDHNITLLALWHDDPAAKEKSKGRLVGAIRCRLLAQPPSSTTAEIRREGPMLYLSTLVLLSPYRSHGIAAQMLDVLTRRAVEAYGISCVGAHVWEANEDGLAWYRKRGFREVGSEKGYYRRLSPSAALVMRREVGVLDLTG